MPPDGNGDYLSRFERLERMAELHSQQIGELIEHASVTDRQIAELREAIRETREAILETNNGVKGLLRSLRALIDRMPSEYLE